MEPIGLIAGNGLLPRLFANAATGRGHAVVAVGHRGETDPSLAGHVSELHWVYTGQVAKILRTLRRAGVRRAVMAGGLGRMRAVRYLRPDWGAVRVMAGLSHFRDDALLRAIAAFFERGGVAIEASTAWIPEILAPEGHLAGPALSSTQREDIRLGMEVGTLLGQADVGQTVVVKGGHVLALEAVEGTDETIRRGGVLGGAGAVVVKLCKPNQDQRFDLPAVGVETISTLQQSGVQALAIEAGRTLVLDAQALLRAADRAKISIVGVARG